MRANKINTRGSSFITRCHQSKQRLKQQKQPELHIWLSRTLEEVNMSHSTVLQGSRKPKTSSSFSKSLYLLRLRTLLVLTNRHIQTGLNYQVLMVSFVSHGSYPAHGIILDSQLYRILSYLIMCTFNAHHLIAACKPDMQGFTHALTASVTLLLAFRL